MQPYAQVLSTISSGALARLTDVPGQFATSLQATPSVTVMVVNLFFKEEGLVPNGFGYLIPRSIGFDQNPECALGVVFDSDSTYGQDTVPGTKLTVMLGGHWWDTFDTYPSAEEGEEMARRVLKRHLNITCSPVAVNASLQKDCIPQYTVGHAKRMQEADAELHRAFGGRLGVTGNSYNGVGLNDCIKNAANLVTQVIGDGSKGKRPLGSLNRISGLEAFKNDGRWVDVVSADLQNGGQFAEEGEQSKPPRP